MSQLPFTPFFVTVKHAMKREGEEPHLLFFISGLFEMIRLPTYLLKRKN
jgi:prolyl oligopeptidase PreP (S9A serine peptidase family)